MYNLNPLKWIKTLLLTCLIAFSSTSLHAEDTEIFAGEIPPSEPNILFLLDQSGSMNTEMGTLGETRLTSLQGAFNAVLGDPDILGINVGLMSFSNGVMMTPHPHGVSFPVSPIDDEAQAILESNFVPAILNTTTNRGYFSPDEDNLPNPDAADQKVRTYLPKILSSWTAFGATPIVDAYYEAALYFRGAPPLWGSASAEYNHAAHPSSYDGTILSEISTVLAGYKTSCSTPDCGRNCVATTTSSYCSSGETSCHLGTNCTTRTLANNYGCSLGTEAECLASNPTYNSCSTSSSERCTDTCTGATHPESGACLGTTERSCTTNTGITCQADTEWTMCDKESYLCDAVTDEVTTQASASYKSPIIDECQNNAIIILSDGQPYVNNAVATDESRLKVKTLIGRAADCLDVPGQELPVTDFNSLADGRCGVELAEFLNTENQSSIASFENTVQTYTVGFGVDGNPEAEVFLKSLAESGGGKYFPARNRAALVSAFKSIIDDIDVSARSFAAPVYTVDPNSMLSHSDDIYLPLFQNSSLPAWSGNIKKFKLNSAGKIIDANGVEAIDGMGVLKPEAVDFWDKSSTARAATTNPVTEGGFANNLVPAARALKTNNGAVLIPLDVSSLTKGELGDSLMTDDHKDILTNYLEGYDADGTTPRFGMGDILHSKPTVISYTNQQVLYFGTNEGFLHAVDAADASLGSKGGTELFAFMPKSLMANVDGIVNNEQRTGSVKRIYGVDGPITAWIIDKNKDGKVDKPAGDKAYLFFGLRRGGNEYYALDVTTPSSPSLAWKIEQGAGDFAALGETWSKPVVAKLRYKDSGTVKFENVLVFGGGYDNRIDDEALANSGSPISGVKGNSVYIVNATTGVLIKSFTAADGLQHSVPSDIRVLDMDRNGSIDRLYFGDTGGNIWRADLNFDDVDSDASLHDVKNDARLTKFASLGGSGVNARKFFYEPDVSLFNHAGKNTLVVSVGSGYRSHPLNELINDRFYVLYDENVFNIPEPAPAPIDEFGTDLVDSNALAGTDFLPNFKGWYKSLVNGNGEKVLASAVTFKNKVMFTTFANTPDTVSTGIGACTTTTKNQTRAYVLDLMTAAPTADLDGDGTVSAVDESIIVSHGDILDSPQLVFNAPSNCTPEGCDQFVDIRVGKKLVPLVDQNTQGGNVNLGDFLPKVFWVNE